MHIGSSLPYGTTAFTPWMRRQADNAVFTFEIIDNPDSTTVTITVYEKNADEYGAGTAKSITPTTTGNFKEYVAEDLEEMVRFRIEVAMTEAADPNGTGIVYRMLEPTWYDEAHI